MAEAENPSYLARHPKLPVLYATKEVDEGRVVAFRIHSDGTLERLNEESSRGAHPCHLAVDPSGKVLLVANYSDGSFAALPIREDGSLSPASSVIRDEGKGPNAERQKGPHAHGIYPDTLGRFAYACDLGIDRVLVFRLDAVAGTLTPNDPPGVNLAAGSGPRHLTLFGGGNYAFVNGELDSSITAMRVNHEAGTLNAFQSLSTRSEAHASTPNTTAEIACHPKNRTVYVSNRGDDSLAAYSVAEDGRLALLGVESAGVAEPRGFAIEPTGRYLVVAGQNSGHLNALAIDQATGRLKPGKSKVAVPSPACILFAAP